MDKREAAKPNLVGREIAVVIAEDSPSLKIPKAKLGKAYEVAEGAEIPVGTEDYDSVTLTPRKYGVRPLISKEMIEDAEWDVVEYQLAEAGRAMADLETEKIISEMISDAGNSVAAGTGGLKVDKGSVYVDFAKCNKCQNCLRASRHALRGACIIRNYSRKVASLVKA